jgi:YVTN family beta-propeller protein
MSEITRRRLLGNAAVGAGGALASSLLPPALARAAARGPQKGSLKDVEHVVVHMQENRSSTSRIPTTPTAVCSRGTWTRARRAHTRFRRPRTPGPISTHRADFGKGESDKVYLSKLAAVEGKDLVTSSGTTYAYVPGIVGGSVAVFDSSTYMMGSSILSGTTNPYGVAARNGGCRRGPLRRSRSHPDGSTVLVTCADGVYAISTAGGNVRKARARLHQPHRVTITPDGKQAYVTDSERDEVVVLATPSLGTLGRIPVGAMPWNTAFTADGASAYVTNANDNTVSVIDTASRKVTDTIPLGANASTGQINQIPTGIALSPNDKIWVACNVSSSLVVIDPSSNAVTKSIDIGLGDGPTEIAFA